MRTTTIVLTVAFAAALVGCENRSSEQAAGAPGARPSWLLASAPADARPVAEAKADAAEGDRVVVRGVIGGRKAPMSAESGVFVMMDPSIPSCLDEGDNCKTPWDYCCETPESITANNATVQLVDAAGKPLELDLASQGLSPLDELIVVGTVGPRPTEQVLTIRATAIYKVGG